MSVTPRSRIAARAYTLAGPPNDMPFTSIGFARASGARLFQSWKPHVRALVALAGDEPRQLWRAREEFEDKVRFADQPTRDHAVWLLEEAYFGAKRRSRGDGER